MYNVVGFEVLMLVTVRKSVFCEVTPFILVETYGHFGETGMEVPPKDSYSLQGVTLHETVFFIITHCITRQ